MPTSHAGRKTDGAADRAKLIAILQRMDRDAPVIVEGEKEAPPAVGVSRTYGVDRKVIVRHVDGSYGDELPIPSR